MKHILALFSKKHTLYSTFIIGRWVEEYDGRMKNCIELTVGRDGKESTVVLLNAQQVDELREFVNNTVIEKQVTKKEMLGK